MAKKQIKLFIFLVTVGLMLGSVATAYWYFIRVIQPEWRLTGELEGNSTTPAPRIDPGLKRFEAAVDLIRADKIDEGREALLNLLRQFPDSSTCREARRIISEMNLDQLFSPTELEGKIDYVVQPGDSLLAIANKLKTSVDAITRMNGLRSNVIHPGDHLLVLPVDFDFAVDLSEKTLTVLRQGKFFAHYELVDVRLPMGMRVPAEAKLGVKSASLDGKTIAPTDPLYVSAEKWLPTSRPGVVVRSLPKAKVVMDVSPPPATGALDPAPETGIFLLREDLEEVFALSRSGAILRILN